MAHPLTLERYLNFVLVRNISPTLDETSAINMLSELFAEQRQIFGVPNGILIGEPSDSYLFDDDIPNSLRAYVTFDDNNILGQVAHFFNNRVSFGRSLKMVNVLIDNPNSPIFRARFIGRDNFHIEGDGGYINTQEIQGYDRMVFSHLNYVIHLILPITEESNTSQEESSQENLNEASALNQPNLPTTQGTDNTLTPRNANQTNDTAFRCNRCLEYYNQVQFENHIEQCKLDETTSMAFCVRQAICTICQFKFLQTSTSQLRYLPCGHILHRDCFVRLLRFNNEDHVKCPNCKARVPEGWNGRINF